MKFENRVLNKFKTADFDGLKHLDVNNFENSFNPAIGSPVTFDTNNNEIVLFYGAEHGRNVDRNQDHAG